jgi:uncharacterized protein YbaP (TraB family)
MTIAACGARRALFVVLALLVVLVGTAPAHSTGGAFEQGLLWKVERTGVRPSYIFGTFHVADPAILSLPKPVADSFAAADSLTIEAELTADSVAQLVRAMRAERGQGLDRTVELELFIETIQRASGYGLSRQRVASLKPWALAMIFSLPPQPRQPADRPGGPALDGWLQQQAMQTGKPHYTLESIAEQIAVYDRLPIAVQTGLLRSVLRSADVPGAFTATRALYLARDIGGIEASYRASLSDLTPEDAALLCARFVEDRNLRMVRRMAERLAEGNAFIAVGALHLAGEKGILRLLQSEGYAVSAVY